VNPVISAVVALAASIPLAAQDGPLGAQDRSQERLDRLRAHMTEVLKQQPNFTCLETVERAILGVREDRFRALDTVRLEVALVNRQEMFAWPGSKEFDDASLRTFVPTGMFGNGYFGMYADTVIRGRRTDLEFRGESQLDQRPVLRYDFRVPVESGTELHAMDAKATVAYRGTLYADAATLDVLKLEVAAENIPVKLGLREATGTVEFTRVRIGESEILLPKASESVMVTWMGDTSRNQMRFSDCREYTGKSTVAFGDTPREAAEAARAKQEIQLPRGLSIVVRLMDETSTDDMAIGDQVRAVLDADVKANGKLLLPNGATVLGRLVRLTRVGALTVVGMIFLEAESETAHAALELNFQRASGPYIIVEPSSGWRLTPSRRPREGVIGLRPGHYRLDRGILLVWRT
jgi:hypothetical protein